ncbi:MAG: hypothetical protein ABJA86_01170 [Nocardioidaceae bacterium]
MILLGLILVVVAACLIAAAVLNGSDSAILDFSAFNIHTTVAGVFGAGAASVLALVIGGWFLRKGLAHRRRRRREVKELRKQVGTSERRVEELKESKAEKVNEPEGDDSDTAFDSRPRE